jgi:hypothetical protein
VYKSCPIVVVDKRSHSAGSLLSVEDKDEEIYSYNEKQCNGKQKSISIVYSSNIIDI